MQSFRIAICVTILFVDSHLNIETVRIGRGNIIIVLRTQINFVFKLMQDDEAVKFQPILSGMTFAAFSGS